MINSTIHKRLIDYYSNLADEMFSLKNIYKKDLDRVLVTNDKKTIEELQKIIKEINGIEIMHKEAVQFWRTRQIEFNK